MTAATAPTDLDRPASASFVHLGPSLAPKCTKLAESPGRIGDGDVVHGDPDGLIQVVVQGDPSDGRTIEVEQAVEDAASRYRCIRWTVRQGATTEPMTFINGVRWQPGPGHVLYGDLCRLAEVTRPLWGLR